MKNRSGSAQARAAPNSMKSCSKESIIDCRLICRSRISSALLWTGSVMNGDNSSPAVTSAGVYVSYACAQSYDFDPINGALLWHHSTNCSGGGGKTPVLANGQLYVRDASSGNVVLDPGDGHALGSFTANRAPAISGARGFFLNNSTLTAIMATHGSQTMEARDLPRRSRSVSPTR